MNILGGQGKTIKGVEECGKDNYLDENYCQGPEVTYV